MAAWTKRYCGTYPCGNYILTCLVTSWSRAEVQQHGELTKNSRAGAVRTAPGRTRELPVGFAISGGGDLVRGEIGTLEFLFRRKTNADGDFQ